jgi:hypothetical protein
MIIGARPARGDEVIEQSGDFRSWHETDTPSALRNVRYQGQSGKHMLSGSFSVFDPDVWSGRALQEVSSTWQMRSCINVSGL